MKITAIEPKKLRKDIYTIYIDDKVAFDVHIKVISDMKIEVGQILNQNRIDDIVSAEDYFKALDYSYLLLSYRKRSVREVRDKLIAKNYSDKVSDEVLNALVETGHLDDLEFCLWWIKQRRKSRPKGDIAIYSELKNKGVDTITIEDAFEKLDIDSIHDEVALAFKACGSMLHKYRHLPYPTARRRLTALLKSRGFSWEATNIVIKEYFEFE